MAAPKVTDPARRKRAMLDLARHAAAKSNDAERTRNNVIRTAAQEGASLREIAEATGIPHTTVKRIIDREPIG